MKLVSIQYSEYKNFAKEWKIEEFQLQEINLIVGKNSDGKSRTLNVIAALANVILTPTLAYANGEWNATFDNNGIKIQYLLTINSGKVMYEKLILGNDTKLDRDNKVATIFNVLVGQNLQSEIPFNQVMIARRDSIQYPYLEYLHSWAKNVKHFFFGTELGKNMFLVQGDSNVYNQDPDLKQNDKVVEVFIRGNKLFPGTFKAAILADLNEIGYYATDLYWGKQENFNIETNGAPLNGLILKERNHGCDTPQFTMSTGMFRALAIIIYFNYFKLKLIEGPVLIDDIGEGLDYDRSTKLINLVIEKAKSLGIQLLMSTNDRFVMNQVPLEFWQVINRVGGCVRMYNEKNHPEIFEDFKFTGLNNFDFFATGFFKEGFKDAE